MVDSNIKIKLLIIQSIDWFLLIVVMAGGVYATINADNRPIIAIIALIALAIVNQFGRWAYTKMAYMRHQLKKAAKEHKKI